MSESAELELSNTLEDRYQFAAMPAGGSGSRTKRPRPDVWASRRQFPDSPGGHFVFEVKRRTKNWPQHVRLTASEVRALRSFGSRAGAEAYIAVRPHRSRSDQDWHFVHVDDLSEAEKNYVIRTSDLPGKTLAEVVGDGE